METPTTDPVAELTPARRRHRGTAAFVGLTTVTLLGAPAVLAAVLSVNEVKATTELTSCLTKTESKDGDLFDNDPANNYYINFDTTTTNVDADTGAAMTQETLSIKAPAGYRTTSTDTITVNAKECGYNFYVQLTANPTNSFGEAAVPNWGEMGLKVYLSNAAGPGDDFTNNDWDQTPLIVKSDGTVANAATGQPILADNSSLTIGFELVGAGATGDKGEFNFQVNFIPQS